VEGPLFSLSITAPFPSENDLENNSLSAKYKKKLFELFLLDFERVNPTWVTTGFAIVLNDEDTVVEGFDAKVDGIDGANLTVVAAVGCFGWLWGFATQGN